MEDEGSDSKHVSSTTKSGKGVQPVELTTEEHELMDHIVAAHQKYAIPVDEAKSFLEETANPEESFFQISETAVLHVHFLVDFTKRLPGFQTLDHEDQIALLKGSTVESMFLRSAQIYNQRVKEYQSPTNAAHSRFSGQSECCPIQDFEKCAVYSRETYHSDNSPTSTTTNTTTTTDIMEEFIKPLFNFYRSMGELHVTETEYALLAATTVFFSGQCKIVVPLLFVECPGFWFSRCALTYCLSRLGGDRKRYQGLALVFSSSTTWLLVCWCYLASHHRPFLKNKVCVEKLQEPLLEILHKYSKLYHPEDPQHFARLVGRLTELRTLNHNHSEVLISWKVKDPKLTSLICDVWDLH